LLFGNFGSDFYARSGNPTLLMLQQLSLEFRDHKQSTVKRTVRN
jgi:hypothetical protein